FELNAALLSRARVFMLKPLTPEALKVIVQRALADEERGLGAQRLDIEPEALEHLVAASGGDARVALNAMELAAQFTPPAGTGRGTIALGQVEEALQHRALLYDKAGEEHYNLISALHKSMRGSDPDAAIYYL